MRQHEIERKNKDRGSKRETGTKLVWGPRQMS